tara:strand:- start:4752 stop:5888 length:1137 start_codon:yes stop_codon:yes gene_type:complete
VDIFIYEKFDSELEGIWLNFEKVAEMTPFQSYCWLHHWQKIIGQPLDKTQLQIVILKNNNSVIAILPLCININNHIKVLSWMGGIQSDYKAPLLHKNWESFVTDFKIVWREVCEKIKSFDVIHLSNQTKKIGELNNPFVSVFDVEPITTSSHANLYGDWDTYYNTKIKKKMRADSRRSIRKLSKIGEFEFFISDSINDSKQVINQMIAQKRRRYLDTGLRDILAIKEHKNFYKELPELSYGTEVVLHCSAIKVDETIIATHIGLIHKKCFYYLMPAYESETWGNFSPGRLLLEKLIEWSFSSNLTKFDFTVGAEGYKEKWCNSEEKIFEYLEVFNLRGYIYLIWNKIKRKVLSSIIGTLYLRKVRIKLNKKTSNQHNF